VLIAALGAAAVALVVLLPDVGACWHAFRRASPLAAAAWWAALALLAFGIVRAEPGRAKGSGPGRRTG